MAPELYKSLNNLAVHTEIIGYLHRFLPGEFEQLSPRHSPQAGVQTSPCILQLHRSVEQPALQLERISDTAHLAHIQNLSSLVASVHS